MGFELNRIMQQYGVGTPGRVNYSGASPVDPGTRPVATDTLTGDKLTAAQTNYDSLLAKYNVDKANAPADTAAYDAYKKEYQTRLMNTPMYMQSQFQTGYEPKSAGLQFATRPDVNVATGSGMGLKQFNTNIQDYATKNPNAYSDAINAYADKYGISGQDIFNATQNRWGNVLQAPKYGPAFTPTATVTALLLLSSEVQVMIPLLVPWEMTQLLVVQETILLLAVRGMIPSLVVQEMTLSPMTVQPTLF